MRIKREKGFTLIELMIVVAIIGILAAVAIPKFADLIDKAREAKAKASLSSLRSAATIYYGGTEGTNPSTLYGALIATYIKELSPVDFKAADSSKTKIAWAKDLEEPATYGGNVADAIKWHYDSSAFEIWINYDLTDLKGGRIHTW